MLPGWLFLVRDRPVPTATEVPPERAVTSMLLRPSTVLFFTADSMILSILLTPTAPLKAALVPLL